MVRMGTRVYVDRELPSATERVARLRLHLRQVPLRELDEAGVLVVDRDENEVKKGQRFEAKWNEVFGQGHSQI